MGSGRVSPVPSCALLALFFAVLEVMKYEYMVVVLMMRVWGRLS